MAKQQMRNLEKHGQVFVLVLSVFFFYFAMFTYKTEKMEIFDQLDGLIHRLI